MMKYLFIIFLLISTAAYGQKTYVIPSDSTKLTTVNGTGNELIIENDTKDTLGVLYNRGGGRTDFRALRLQQLTDSTFRLLLGNTAQGQTITIRGTGSGNFVPYTGATGDVDLGANVLNAESLRVTGTNGDGHLHLRHQASDATGSGNNTVLFANSSGDLKYKNDNLYYTTYRTSGNTADRIYRFPDSSGTVALLSNVLTYTMTKKADSIVLTGSNGARFAVRDTFVAGGGVDSIYRYRLYADLYNEWADSSLISGNKYVITNFKTVYAQQRQPDDCGAFTTIEKSGAIEPLVVTAVSSYTLDEYASSLTYPKDVIRYDIGYQKTISDEYAAFGRIYYRQDSTNNSAWYDWRAIQFYNTSDNTEYYTFNSTSTMNELSFTTEYGILSSFDEYPSAIFLDLAFHNSGNLIYGGSRCGIDTNFSTIFYGIFSQNSANQIIASSFYGQFTQNSNNLIEYTRIDGNALQNTTMDIDMTVIRGNMEFCQASAISNSTFGDDVAKLTNSNISNSTILGQVDRCVNTAVLRSNIGGEYYWCNGMAMSDSDIDSSFRGVNYITWDSTDANCIIENIVGISGTAPSSGVLNCSIVGASKSSKLQYITLQTIIIGKTIDEATYPELFSAYPKTIFKGSDTKIYFSYYNGSTYVIREII